VRYAEKKSYEKLAIFLELKENIRHEISAIPI
jgi:hypothetical protein